MDETRVIDYLYGEMSAHDKQQFEQAMKEDPGLSQQVREMKGMQAILREDLDEQPTAAIHLYEPKKVKRIDPRWWMAAASLMLLLVAGKLVDLRLELGNGQVALHYGDQNKAESLDRNDVLNLMAAEFDNYQQQLENRLQQMDAKLTQNVRAEEEPQWETHFADYREEFTEFQQDLRKDQTERYSQFIDQMQRDRRNYSRELMEDLFLYVEEQRRQDLEAINQGFLQLSQSLQGDNASTRFVNQPLKKY